MRYDTGRRREDDLLPILIGEEVYAVVCFSFSRSYVGGGGDAIHHDVGEHRRCDRKILDDDVSMSSAVDGLVSLRVNYYL